MYVALNVETLDDLTYIEDVLNIPLYKFIRFTFNYCGCTGKTYYLMINWVHPMFLESKAEASKEGNTN